MGGPESQEIQFRTTNKPAELISGGSAVHSSGRISKGSDDRDMQFAAEFLKTVEDPTENGNPPRSTPVVKRDFTFFSNPGFSGIQTERSWPTHAMRRRFPEFRKSISKAL